MRYGIQDIAKEFSFHHVKNQKLRKGEFWALDDVSFDVARGESLAVIGENGAGKSTLLKVLYGLIKPDAGEVRIKGRVSALIELGTGFNPVLSGSENVFVNAAVLGISRRQVARYMEEIIEFSGLEDVINTPVQYYSSGMKARLSYAVAAVLNPDVLLVDEVLAVGDIAFQRKCLNHMQGYLERGGSLVFVSHSPYQIQAICGRGIVLENGRLKFAGTAVEGLNYYFEHQPQRQLSGMRSSAVSVAGNQPIVIEEIIPESESENGFWTGEKLVIKLRYRSTVSREIVWGFNVWTGDQWVCITGAFDMRPRQIAPGSGELRCVIPRNPLTSGSYWLKAAIIEATSLQVVALFGWQNLPLSFSVRSQPSELNNAQTAINQLMTIDVEWE